MSIYVIGGCNRRQAIGYLLLTVIDDMSVSQCQFVLAQSTYAGVTSSGVEEPAVAAADLISADHSERSAAAAGGGQVADDNFRPRQQ